MSEFGQARRRTADLTGKLAAWWSGTRRSPGRALENLKRARDQDGSERENAVLLFKSALAGVLSWSLAAYVVASPQPTYAPFTALLVVQATAYRSLLHSVRYLISVILGVCAAGVAGPLLGENALAFAAMLVPTLLIGRWRRLGSEGVQVSVAGVFAYHALSGTHTSMLWEIISMALVGAGMGIAVTLLILPPLRYRSATDGIGQLSRSLQKLLQDIADGLCDGLVEQDVIADWLRRARQLDITVGSARSAVENGAESLVYNPRRLLPSRATAATFGGYRTLLESLARAGEQIRSICYGLQRICDDDTSPRPSDDFLRSYAQLLDLVAQAAARIGCLDEDEGGDTPLHHTLGKGRTQHEKLSRSVAGASSWASHGVLLTDAERLLEEFAHAHRQGAVQPSAP